MGGCDAAGDYDGDSCAGHGLNAYTRFHLRAPLSAPVKKSRVHADAGDGQAAGPVRVEPSFDPGAAAVEQPAGERGRLQGQDSIQ